MSIPVPCPTTRQHLSIDMKNYSGLLPYDIPVYTRHFAGQEYYPRLMFTSDYKRWLHSKTTSLCPLVLIYRAAMLNTGTRHFGKYGTTSISAPGTSGSSVRPPRISRVLVYPTTYPCNHYLAIYRMKNGRRMNPWYVYIRTREKLKRRAWYQVSYDRAKSGTLIAQTPLDPQLSLGTCRE